MIINKKGLSLAELIVATVIISIIMLGIVATDIAIRRMDENATSETKAFMELGPILEHILTNAQLAVGSTSAPGFCFEGHSAWDCGIGTGKQTFCIVHDTLGVDIQCYTHLAYPDNRLYTCDEAAFVDCDTGDTLLGLVAKNTFDLDGDGSLDVDGSLTDNPVYDSGNNEFCVKLSTLTNASDAENDPTQSGYDETLPMNIKSSIDPVCVTPLGHTI